MNLIDLVYHSAGIVVVTLGWYVFFSNRSQRNNKIFFYLTLAVGGWIESIWWAFYFLEGLNWDMALILFRLSFLFAGVGVSFFTLFFYFFPRVIKPVKKHYKILFLILITVGIALAPSPLVYGGIIVENGMPPSDDLGVGYPIFMAHVLINYLISVYFAIKKYVQSRGIEKKKLSYVTVGILAFVLVVMVTNLILPAFRIVQLDLQKFAPLWSLLFIVPAFYALRRYRFFNFSNASLNSIRGMAISIAYAGSVVICYFVLALFTGHGVLRGIISAIFGLFIYEVAKRKLPILVTAEFKQFKNEVTSLKARIYQRNSYEELEKIIEETFLIQLNFVNVQLFVVRNEPSEIGVPVYQSNEFSNILSHFFKDAIIKDEIAFNKHIKPKEREVLKNELGKLRADLCLPLFSEKNLIGFFVLRQSNAYDGYPKEVLNEIMSLKSDLEIGLMNILLKMNLQEENNLMKQIIDEKTRELKKKVKEINELLKQQSDFISVTAHEFRTPLSIAAFQLEEILGSDEDLNKHREDIKVIDYTIDNLKQLTERLFTVQQYDLNKVDLDLKEVEIKDFVTRLYAEFYPIMHEKQIKFKLKDELESPQILMLDPVQMRQVLHNLLKNASKFTPKRGRVILCLKREGGDIHIQIKDNGTGIPDQLKNSIFDKFRTKSRGSGIGLGLYLCKKIIGLHKGKIWVEDNKKHGANFIIELPIKIKKN